MTEELERQIIRETDKESELESLSYKHEIKLPEEYKGVLLTPEQFNSVIAYAETARDLEKRGDATERLHISEEMRRKGISVEGAYRYAKDMLEIDHKFVDRAMRIYYPSVEQKLAEISRYNAGSTPESVIDDYIIELNKTMKENLLENNLMLRVGKINRDYAYTSGSITFGLFYKDSKKIKIPFTKRHISFNKERELGRILLWLNKECSITAYDPMFLPLFGDKLKKLSQRWEIDNKFEHSYNPYKEK